MKIKSVLVGLITVLILLGCLYGLQSKLESDNKNQDKIIKLFVDGKTIFIITNIHGVSENHQRILITTDENSRYQKDYDYAFFNSEIYYRIDQNRIEVFAPESGRTTPINGDLKDIISVHGLKNYDEIRDYDINFKEYNLERVSVYDD
jgi:hypothetical protein